MRIQHNIMAMNAYRNYNTNNKALSGNLEKLSSGYKINRAGDDAAGLAISEKMRAQITGLEAAQKNVKDGISLVKTAEGAMQEIQDMLNRMDYLATQSANGTYQDEVDREALQQEVDQLRTEINRIADSANFNGIKLLDGSLAQTEAVEGSTTTETASISGMDRILTPAANKGDVAYEVAGNKTILDSVPGGTPTAAAFEIDLSTLSFSVQGTAGGGSATVGKAVITIEIEGTKLSTKASGIAAANGTIAASAVANSIASQVTANGGKVTINGVEWTVAANGSKLTFTQTKIPETADEAHANFDVSVSIKDSEGGGSFGITLPEEDAASNGTGTVHMSDSVKVGTYVSTPGIAKEDANRANTVFNITADDIKDGTKIAIGTTSIVLKVGSNSTVEASATDNTVDKYGNKIVTLSADADLNTALSKISNTIGSTVNLKIWDPDAKSVATVAFQIGVSDSSQGFPSGLTLVRQTAVDPNGTGGAKLAFDSLEKLANNFKMEVTTTTTVEAKAAGAGLNLQIGDTSDDFNQMKVFVGDMHTSAMGTEGGNSIADIDIGTSEGAQAAVDVIKDAINYVSSVRGNLGAYQNRLEHTQNNLSVMAENIQDAESTIRDTDVAEEMMSYVKNNILVQSAQAMLAQANQVPQGVLQLLG